jgi:hypothetical protein
MFILTLALCNTHAVSATNQLHKPIMLCAVIHAISGFTSDVLEYHWITT